MKQLRCECGQKLFRRDIVKQEYYVRQFGPSFVYLKFRCSRCNRLGERYVRQEEWMPSTLEARLNQEGGLIDRALMAELGPLTEAEHDAARREMAETNPLDTLRLWFAARQD